MVPVGYWNAVVQARREYLVQRVEICDACEEDGDEGDSLDKCAENSASHS